MVQPTKDFGRGILQHVIEKKDIRVNIEMFLSGSMTQNKSGYAGSLEVNWLQENYDEVKKLYWHKWIHVRGKEIIDADKDLQKLITRLGGKEKLINGFTFHITSKKLVVDNRSWGFRSFG